MDGHNSFTITAADAERYAETLRSLAQLARSANRAGVTVPEGAFIGADLGPVTVKVTQ